MSIADKVIKGFFDPKRAFRFLYISLFYRAWVPMRYFFYNECIFYISNRRFSFLTKDFYSKSWFYPRCINNSFHEPVVTNLIEKIAPSAAYFVDVGAHLGYFSVLAGTLMSGKQIYSFELDSRAFRRLAENVEHNKLKNVSYQNVAVSGATGSVRVKEGLFLDSGLHIEPDENSGGIQVKAVALDDCVPVFLDGNGLIKIDVEGAEHEVLKGMRRILNEGPTLLLEVHGNKLRKFNSSSKKLIAFLEALNFSVYVIENHRKDVSVVKLKKISASDESIEQNIMTIVLPNKREREILMLTSSNPSLPKKNIKINEPEEFYGELPRQVADMYEESRWKKNAMARAHFDMTESYVDSVAILARRADKYIEVGSGPGTWSQVFRERNPKMHMTLVDISEEMLNVARAKLSNDPKVRFVHSDFLNFNEGEEKYTLFFSSRAFEYIGDLELAVHKVGKFLAPGSYGVVITKNPHPFRDKLFRHSAGIHSRMINSGKLISELEKNYLKVERINPVTMTFPVLRTIFLSKVLYWLFSKFRLSLLNSWCTESYGVVFRKL